MKALIRNTGETVLETDNIEGIDWTTGAPLTNPSWAGGAYALCAECPVSDPEPGDFDFSEIEIPAEGEEQEDGTIHVTATITKRRATFVQARYDARKAQEASE